MTPEERRRATEFLERLLAEPQLRAEFRRRPATTCRAFELDELADELETGTRGSVTLEQRESRSGMAGIMIAAAAEGVGLAELLARHATEMGVASAATASGLIERIGAEETAMAPANGADRLDGERRSDTATSAADAGAALPVSAPDVPAGLPPAPAAEADGSSLVAASAGAGVAADAAGLPPVTAQPVARAPEATPAAQGEVQLAAAPQPVRGGDAAQQAQAKPSSQVHAAVTEAADGYRAGHASAAVLEPAADTAQDYPGDAAPKAQIAAWMAQGAAAAGLPEELPVMAALVESGLTNLNYGDRDSVGFFQMRLGIWNHGDYRGYPDDAELQLRWFLDQAAALKSNRMAAGDAAFGRDPSSWGTWIADVERPAEAYRERYQGQLDAARELLASGRPAAAADPPAGATAAPAAPTAVSAAALAADLRAIDPSAAASASADQAVSLAKQYLGDAYVWGGASPETGFDCSGLVQYVYQQAGVHIPRVTHEQFEVGQAVDRSALRTGDIVFFREPDGYIGHEGLYLGDGRFLHAPHTGDVVKISSLDEPYFDQSFAGARRVGESAAATAQNVDMMRRTAGELTAARRHDARVLPLLDPTAARPGPR